MRVPRFLLLATFAATVLPAAALAQPPPPSAADISRAGQYVSEGIAAQNRGDYDLAIEKFEQAYQAAPHALMFFNQAQAHRLAGRLDRALALYQQYIAADPNGTEVQKAGEWVADLKPRIAARNAEQARKDDEARKATESRLTGAPGSQRVDPLPRTEEAPGRTMRLTGIAVGAAGVISLGVGIGYAFHSQTLDDRYAKLTGAEQTANPALRDEGFRANKIGWVTGIGGVVLIGAGAGLYWWGYRQDHGSDRIALTPVLSNQQVGLAISGSL